MPDALLIRFGNDPTRVQYLLVDAAGGRLGAVLSGPLSQVAPLAANRRVIVLLPGTDVISAEPNLPAKGTSRLAQLAPFAVEEQLASDIDTMHFAVGQRTESGKTPVQALLRTRFEAWLALLSEAGIAPDAIYSEASVIPESAGATLIVDTGLVLLRKAGSPGVALEAQPLQATLDLALDSLTGSEQEEHVLRDLQLYVTQIEYERERALFDGLSQRIGALQIKLLAEGPLPLLALQAVRDGSVNLLFGPYERKSSFATHIAPWKYAAVLLGVAVALHLVYSGTRLWRAARTESDVDKQINELVMQTLPGVKIKDARDARKQFDARLGILKQGGGRGDLLSNLSTIGEALAQSPETKVEAIFYRADTIDLRVTAPNVDALDKIQQSANAAGLTTTIQSATPRDSKVEGRLQLKPGV